MTDLSALPPPPSGPPAKASGNGCVLAVLAAMVVIVVLMGIGVAWVLRPIQAHDVLVTDFHTAATPFPAGAQDGYTATTADGDYVMTQTAEAEHDRSGAVQSSLYLSKGTTAGTVWDATVDVHPTPAGKGQPIAVGIGCAWADEGPGAQVLLVSPDGTDIRLVTWTRAFDNSDTVHELARTAGEQPPQRIRLVCSSRFEVEGGSGTDLTGYVNDREVIKETVAPSMAGPKTVVLVFDGAAPGTEARFGDVRALGL
jgi:hypothetical protein